MMDKTNDWFLEAFISVVCLNSEYDSVQLWLYLFIFLFSLICNLTLTRLYTYVELYYAKLK